MDHLNDLLGRGDAFHHLHAPGGLAHAVDEFLDHLEVDVRFQQSKTHLAQGVLNVRLGELRASAQIAEDAGESVGQTFKHGIFRSDVWNQRALRKFGPQVKSAGARAVASIERRPAALEVRPPLLFFSVQIFAVGFEKGRPA